MYGGEGVYNVLLYKSPPKYIPAYVHRYYSVPILSNPQKLFCHHKLLVGCKHRASEVLLYIGGRGFVCQIIEPVTIARSAFIFALRNIALDGYVETFRTFTARRMAGLKYIYIHKERKTFF